MTIGSARAAPANVSKSPTQVTKFFAMPSRRTNIIIWTGKIYPTVLFDQLAAVEMNEHRAAVLGPLHHVFGAAGAVAGGAIPQRDQSQVVLGYRQRVVQHPEIGTGPDAVVLLGAQPARQSIRIEI